MSRCRPRSLLVVLVTLALACGEPEATWSIDGRRDLLLDGARVELLEGFADVSALRVLGDVPRVNLDRDAVVVPMPRTGRLRWHVSARAGRFVGSITRLAVGPAADSTAARLVLTARRGDAIVARGEVSVPAAPAGPPDEGTGPPPLREGPAADVTLELPQGAEVLELAFESEGDPALGWLALLSPRIEQEPLVVAPADHPLRFEREQRIAAAMVPEQPRRVLFATRSDDLVTDVPVEVDAVESVGSFEGRIGRRALALTGAARAELVLDIAAGAVLHGDLALDARLPRDTRGRLVVSIDGEEVARHDVSTGDWQPLELPLGPWAGRGRRLVLALQSVHLEPGPVVRLVPDYERRIDVPTTFVAAEVRLGIADPRVGVPTEVPRRVARPERPSVLLLHVETLRADLLPGFGGELADLAPNLARLARCATTYTTAIAPSSWTLPSTASLLTGLPPSAHRVIRHDMTVLPDDVSTLAERARAAGVTAGAVVTNSLLRADAGFGRGFETYVELPHHNARQVNDFVQAFLAGHAGQQSLLFVHYYDPHHPYDAPAGWRDRYVPADLVGRSDVEADARIKTSVWAGQAVADDDPDVRFLRSRYLGEIAWFDAQLGELLSFLDREGLAATTSIVLTADHGEEFLEHGLLGHGSNLFDETLRVPLLVAEPGSLVGWATGSEPARGSAVARVVGTGGLFAEILHQLDVPFDAEAVLPGVSTAGSEPSLAFAETEKGLAPSTTRDPLRRPLRAVRGDGHLLVWHLPLMEEGEPDEGWMCFYDLAADPQARFPLDAVGREADYYRAQLEAALRWSQAHAAEVPPAALDAAMASKLAALGYLSAPGASGQAPCADH